MNIRLFVIRTIIAALCVYNFFFSAGWHKLNTENQLDFMSLFIPQWIFGAWAVLTVFYDLTSADQEHKVLDTLLTSGVTNSEVCISKTLAACAAALFMTFLYLLPVAEVVAGMTGRVIYPGAILRYAPPLWGYIMVHALEIRPGDTPPEMRRLRPEDVRSMPDRREHFQAFEEYFAIAAVPLIVCCSILSISFSRKFPFSHALSRLDFLFAGCFVRIALFKNLRRFEFCAMYAIIGILQTIVRAAARKERSLWRGCLAAF